MTIAAAAMAASGVMDQVSQAQQAGAVNKAAKKTYASIIESDANQRVGLDRRTLDDAKVIQQQGFEAKLQESLAVSTEANAAVSRGVSGVSVDALIAEQYRTGAKNKSRLDDQRENNQFGFEQQSRAISSQTNQRIDATPTAKFGITDMAIGHLKNSLKIAGTIASAQAG